MKDTRTHLTELLEERIFVLDGSWGVLSRGGTHGSPAGLLLRRAALNESLFGLTPGKARLRPRVRTAWENG